MFVVLEVVVYCCVLLFGVLCEGGRCCVVVSLCEVGGLVVM